MIELVVTASLVGGATAVGFYILLVKLLKAVGLGGMVRKTVTNPVGSFLLDLLMFGGGVWFMTSLAGASMFAMTCGAMAGVIGSAIIALHRQAIYREIQTFDDVKTKVLEAVDRNLSIIQGKECTSS